MTLFIHRNAGGRCPCGAENATCGSPSSVVPVDQFIEEVPAVSGPLKKYRVTRNGVETVMKLSDDDAKRLGVAVEQPADAASTAEPVQPADAPETGDVAPPSAKRRTTSANKARSAAANKAADGGN